MSQSSASETGDQPVEGKLIQIGTRQIRRNHARAIRVQQVKDSLVPVSDEASLPAPMEEPSLPATAPPPAPTPQIRPQARDFTRRSVRYRGRSWFFGLATFLVFAVVPGIIGLFYYGWFATDQYVAEAKFAIRSQSSPMDPASGMSSILGNSLATIGDTMILADYIHSDQMLRDIEDDVDIRALYSVEKADWWARLDPTVSREKLLSYWKWMSTVAVDPATGITTLSVRGFAPEDALRISNAVLTESEKLINRLSERARADALSVANAEMAAAQKRVDDALAAIQGFQTKEKQINVAGAMDALSSTQAKLNSDLTRYETELTSLLSTMAPDAPTIVVLRRKIDAVKAQLDAEKHKATADIGQESTMPELSAEYEKLKLNQTFAEKAYTSAQQSLEAARVEAGRQVKYLEPFVKPRIPEASLYPNRAVMMGLWVGGGILLWLMVLLMVATIREHL